MTDRAKARGMREPGGVRGLTETSEHGGKEELKGWRAKVESKARRWRWSYGAGERKV